MGTVKALTLLVIVQLMNYGVVFLVGTCLLGFLVARRFRWIGVFGLHVVIFVLLFVLDISWISAEMAKPGWDGTPDQDGVFYLGFLMRVFLFNTLLTIIGWRTIRQLP
jgi:hypothetical protein